VGVVCCEMTFSGDNATITLKQESLADAKVSARECVYESPYRRNLSSSMLPIDIRQPISDFLLMVNSNYNRITYC